MAGKSIRGQAWGGAYCDQGVASYKHLMFFVRCDGWSKYIYKSRVGFKGFCSGIIFQIFAIKCGFCLAKKESIKVTVPHSSAVVQKNESFHFGLPLIFLQSLSYNSRWWAANSLSLTLCNLADRVDCLQQRLQSPENPPFFPVTGELFSQAYLSPD